MTPAQKASARRSLTRLVTPEGTRARRTDSELTVGDPVARAALDALVRGRLLVAHEADDGSAYELSHEVLVRGWATLRSWLVEDADQRMMQDRVQEASREWVRLNKGRDALWGPRQLGEAIRVRESELAPVDREFLAASRRKLTRRRWAVRGAFVAVPALIVVIYFGVQAANRRSLDRKVDRLQADAVQELDEAHAKVKIADDHRARAYALFDAPDLAAQTPTAAAAKAWELAVAATAVADAALAHVARSFEVALSADPDRADVRKRLGQTLLLRAIRAEQHVKYSERDELVERLSLYDPDGTVMAAWTAPSRIDLRIVPADAVVTIQRDGVDERQPLTTGTMLPSGSYVVHATAPGHAPLRYPIVAHRGVPTTLELQLLPAAAVPEGFVAIAAGEFQFGTADDMAMDSFFQTVPIHLMRTDGYLIGRHEVTMAAWIEFLEALPDGERRERTPYTEQTGPGAIILAFADGAWQLRLRSPSGELRTARPDQPVRLPERDRRVEQDWMRFPVIGVSALDGNAYARWLDETGRVPGARLCTEAEWERAGRGADTRTFPHGDRFQPDDVNIDVTYGKNSETMGVDEVGSHPRSQSPFGLDDMSGNAGEWTTSVLGKDHVLRGGSFWADANTGRVINRNESVPEVREATTGLRICAPWPGSTPPS
jgi:formylglycine-generating enzyme required for sulfatase activity